MMLRLQPLRIVQGPILLHNTERILQFFVNRAISSYNEFNFSTAIYYCELHIKHGHDILSPKWLGLFHYIMAMSYLRLFNFILAKEALDEAEECFVELFDQDEDHVEDQNLAEQYGAKIISARLEMGSVKGSSLYHYIKILRQVLTPDVAKLEQSPRVPSPEPQGVVPVKFETGEASVFTRPSRSSSLIQQSPPLSRSKHPSPSNHLRAPDIHDSTTLNLMKSQHPMAKAVASRAIGQQWEADSIVRGWTGTVGASYITKDKVYSTPRHESCLVKRTLPPDLTSPIIFQKGFLMQDTDKRGPRVEYLTPSSVSLAESESTGTFFKRSGRR